MYSQIHQFEPLMPSEVRLEFGRENVNQQLHTELLTSDAL